MTGLSELWSFSSSFSWAGPALSFVVSFALGYLASVLAGPQARQFTDRVKGKAVRRLLRFSANDIIVVLPHQPGPQNRRLPHVAVEDVLALRNVFDLLAEIGIKHPKIRHPENLTDSDLKKNIVSIGGSNRNQYTAAVLRAPVNGDTLAFVASTAVAGQVELHRGSTTVYNSPSYGEPPSDQARTASKDVAFILRRPNPKNETAAVLLLAGIRGIGTWGASDHLRKHSKALAQRVARDQGGAMNHGFLALLEIEYENFDIVRTKVKDISSILDDG